MKKNVVCILAAVLVVVMLLGGCAKTTVNENRLVLAAAIVPVQTFIKAVGGTHVDVVTLIPSGYSPANYQPTTKEMMALARTQAYFSIGVPTEHANILPKLKEFNKDIKIIPLQESVKEVYAMRILDEPVALDGDHDHEKGHDHSKEDPHIWLSPRRVIVMINTIKEELTRLDPKHAEDYEANAQQYIKKLEKLDRDTKAMLSDHQGKAFIIYHGAYGYFAEDYGLKMVSIEDDGKQATAKKLEQVVQYAKEHGIKTILYQEEFDDQQAVVISREIGGQAMKISPLSPNYINSMRAVAEALAEEMG